MVAARSALDRDELARRRVVAELARLVGPRAPSTAPDPAALPTDAEVLLQLLERLPLGMVLQYSGHGPLRRCPRSSCGGELLFANERGFACRRCFLAGGTGAFLAGFMWDFGPDELHAALCTRPGCDHG